MRIDKHYAERFEAKVTKLCSGGSDAPPAPDYRGAAIEQGAANAETARIQGRLNNPNYSTPYGSRQVIFGQNGDPDSVKIVDSLTPTGQKAFDTQQRINDQLGTIAESGLNRVQGGFEKPFDTSGLSNRVTNIQADDAARQRIEQGLLDRQQPLLDRQRARTESNLRQQGITSGSEAYNNAMDDLGRQENDARLAAIAQGGAEQSRLFGMSATNADLANNQRQAQVAEQAYMRSLPLNELNALRTGTQISTPQFQQYSGAGNIQAPNLMGATQAQNQAALNAWSAEEARRSQNINTGVGTAAALGSAYLLAASDRRLKKDIKHLGYMSSGLPYYSYTYVWDETPQVGVMADEVESIFPDAVFVREDGYKMVDYSRIH